jgi:16S rRNA (cytidine1402-2'-O)-methyltransferase
VIVLVATPIGNLGDLSSRAAETLAAAAVVAAEDTRRARQLLSHLGLHKPLVSYHRANEKTAGPQLIARALAGDLVAMVSDAGMPGISDPGEALVRRAVDAGVDVDVIPGPSAPLTALVLSGLRTDRFVMEGFLPRRGRERRDRLHALQAEERTVVLFEAPHRVSETLSDLAAALGTGRRCAVTRELTKRFQSVWRGPLLEAAGAIGEARGEYTIVIEGAAPAEPMGAEEVAVRITELVAAGRSPRDAAALAAEETGLSRSAAYRAWLAGRDPVSS